MYNDDDIIFQSPAVRSNKKLRYRVINIGTVYYIQKEYIDVF